MPQSDKGESSWAPTVRQVFPGRSRSSPFISGTSSLSTTESRLLCQALGKHSGILAVSGDRGGLHRVLPWHSDRRWGAWGGGDPGGRPESILFRAEPWAWQSRRSISICCMCSFNVLISDVVSLYPHTFFSYFYLFHSYFPSL